MGADVERQVAVRRGPRRRDEPVGHLFLDHDDEAREEVGAADEGADHRRRRLVRQVADERHGGRRAGVCERRGDVDAERVGRQDGERRAGELAPQRVGQRAVDLEGHDPDPAREERPRQRAPPGPDLDDRVTGPGAEGVEDLPGGRRHPTRKC